MPANEIPRDKSQSRQIAESIQQVLAEGSVAIVATVIESSSPAMNVGAKLLSTADKQTVGGFGSKDLEDAVNEQAKLLIRRGVGTRVFEVKEFAPSLAEWADSKILFERIELEPRLVICGAGHVGASLARLATLLGYRTTLIDDRAEFVNPESFAHTSIELVCAENWPVAIVAAVGNGHGISVAIVTRGHSEDEQCLKAVIDLEVDYIGMIGSKRRTKIVLDRLRESGVIEPRLAKVHAPVGLDIGAVTPEEVALAIMAEIVAVRRGGKGGFLYLGRRPMSDKP
jgi:xanthine dehydrogenase accessory factor